MFTAIGDATTFSLNQMKINAKGCTDGGAYGSCFLQVLSPTDSKVDQSRIYMYWGNDDYASPEDPPRWLHDDGSELEDGEDIFPFGTAFLCNFDPSLGASIQFAGEVATAPQVVISTRIPDIEESYYKNLYIINPIAADLNLNEDVKINAKGCSDGGTYGSCFLQVLNPSDSKVDQSKIYMYWGNDDYASPEDPPRWLHDDGSELEDGEEVLKMGAGFLCNFDPSLGASIVFKNKVK